MPSNIQGPALAPLFSIVIPDDEDAALRPQKNPSFLGE